MFGDPRDILRASEGTLAQAPLPLLLHALYLAERTVALELKAKGVEKRILLEEGTPVACSSNLLHETLGRFLVDNGKLTEAQQQLAFAESARTGQRMGEILVQKGWLAPFDLYKQLQANMAHKILDCFRWEDARYRIVPEPQATDVPVKMNALQLILKGVTTVLPFEVVSANFPVAEGDRLALAPHPPHALQDIKLGAKETRILQALRRRPAFKDLGAALGAGDEELLRRLYALAILGLLETTATAGEAPAPAVPSAPEPAAEPAPEPPASDRAIEEALTTAYLEHRRKDPVQLLEVSEDATPVALRRAFLSLADKFSPTRIHAPELKEKAEALLVAYARAFVVLADPEQNALWKSRRRAAEAKPTARPSTEEQFRIKTDLLDSQAQFGEGIKRLEAQSYAAALEHFQYACDIDRKPRHVAYLAWTRYRMNPASHSKLALQELTEAMRADPPCEEAYAFAAEIHKRAGDYSLAEECYRRAYKTNPTVKRYADEIQEMIKLQKRR